MPKSTKRTVASHILKDKKFNFAPKIGWRALAEGEPNLLNSNWRRVQDSNLQGLSPTGFQDQRISHSANPPFRSSLIIALFLKIRPLRTAAAGYAVTILEVSLARRDVIAPRLRPNVAASAPTATPARWLWSRSPSSCFVQGR